MLGTAHDRSRTPPVGLQGRSTGSQFVVMGSRLEAAAAAYAIHAEGTDYS